MNSVRKILAQHDIRPRKNLGQSFLEDMNVTSRIAALAQVSADETVVEIGAGLGFLTAELEKQAARVIALEIDPRLLDVLGERFAGHEKVEIVAGDVLDYDFASVCPGRKIKVVGNIPYNISTPILFHLIRFRTSISLMVLMFQRELAERIMALPGKRDYGIPSVILARYGSTTRELTIPPTCFYPEPSVASTVIRTVMHDVPETGEEERMFMKTVRVSFSKRRKTLWNNLRSAGIPEDLLKRVLTQAGIEGTRRAETLSVEEYARLASELTAGNPDQKVLDKKGFF
jgi:16S rRNA (adenine1518-N6/adenine1519-N6)-dimethyltransferase